MLVDISHFPEGIDWARAATNKANTILNDYHSGPLASKPKLKEFTRFSDLPTEIRWSIWNFALNSNRLVGVALHIAEDDQSDCPSSEDSSELDLDDEIYDEEEDGENGHELEGDAEGAGSQVGGGSGLVAAPIAIPLDVPTQVLPPAHPAPEEPERPSNVPVSTENSAQGETAEETDVNETGTNDTSNALDNPPEPLYWIECLTRHRNSPILATSREARQVALSYYRVRIASTNDPKRSRRYLYFNPDFDILYVNTNGCGESLIEFLADVKSSDPHDVGVRNLGIGGTDRVRMYMPMGLTAHPRASIEKCRSVIQDLDKIFFYSVGSSESRFMCVALRMNDAHHNRSFPLFSAVEEFDLLDSDPRPIEPDMPRICFGRDPSAMVYAWRKTEEYLKIDRSQRSPEQILLVTAPIAVPGDSRAIQSRANANKSLDEEASHWRYTWEDDELFRNYPCRNPDTPEKLSRDPIPAIGFWMLPAEILGEPMTAQGTEPLGPVLENHWQSCRIIDLSKHRPQLGLYRL